MYKKGAAGTVRASIESTLIVSGVQCGDQEQRVVSARKSEALILPIRFMTSGLEVVCTAQSN